MTRLALAVVVGGLLAAAALAPAWTLAADPALAAAGKRLFIRCAACHSVSAAAPPMFGPHLEGIVDRTAGSVEGFVYSEPSILARSFVWDEAYFDEWLERPHDKYPTMCLAFSGLANSEARKALIAYLKHPGT
jgi:cytochrome c